jgi:MFS family permease
MNRFPLTPARLIMAVFFMQAVVVASLYPRYPDIEARLAVGPGELWIAFLGMPVGSLAALLASGSIVERLTPRWTILFAFVLYCFAAMLPGFAWDVASLFVALLALGLAYPLIDVSMNVEANRIERTGGRKIMSTCHGFWSIGAMTGSAVGVAFAWIGLDVRWQMVIVGLAALPFALVVPKLPDTKAAEDERQVGRAITLPTLGMLGVCFFAFGMIAVEMANRQWSAIFLHDVFARSTAVAGIGPFAFATAMALGRFLGDWLTTRLGPVGLARLCTLLTIAGIAIWVGALDLVMAIAGLAAAGLGVSVAFPLAVTAVANRGDRRAPVNVGAFQLFTSVSALLIPPLIGKVAEAGGLRLGVAMLLPLLVVSLLMTGELGGGKARAAQALAEAEAKR